MRGTIAVEEAVIPPFLHCTLAQWQPILAPGSDVEAGVKAHGARLSDIHDKRLQTMDAEGVEYMLLSLTSPGAQGESDQTTAEKVAREANDWLAGEVIKNPQRFGALAAVSMHNPGQAAEELRRCVKELGMFGGLVNDWQSTGADGTGRKYYDTDEYDVFWSTVQELDVPIYFHPRYPPLEELKTGQGVSGAYKGRSQMLGAGCSFHLDLSWHIYAVCSSGVFDRFPKVQIVAGHLGEGIPFNLWRADHWLNKPQKKKTRPSKHDYTYYFKNNVHITTSGNFNTAGLKFCINEIGHERCLYAIDTPYDVIEEGQEWWRNIDLPEPRKDAVARSNAIRLFKLPLQI
ncbi:hypothetical protein GTA08_BOTSDO13697 [Botryosphaeria dothidea]|uniref:Amidohydrolase-related domain-containing protein n=1 Tax=Botryosphaeria dothidea TaxID=55169 RepID=A0A8H4J056_9PEZI|nr:hypothetical protein GTA08_BOTSDO13697 [Botryosphaeria dothidea]